MAKLYTSDHYAVLCTFKLCFFFTLKAHDTKDMNASQYAL